MLDPHNIPYGLINRDRRNGYVPTDSKKSSSFPINISGIGILQILIGVLIGLLIR